MEKCVVRFFFHGATCCWLFAECCSLFPCDLFVGHIQLKLAWTSDPSNYVVNGLVLFWSGQIWIRWQSHLIDQPWTLTKLWALTCALQESNTLLLFAMSKWSSTTANTSGRSMRRSHNGNVTSFSYKARAWKMRRIPFGRRVRASSIGGTPRRQRRPPSTQARTLDARSDSEGPDSPRRR